MKISKNLYNWLSLTGSIIAVNCLLLIVILFVASIFFEVTNAYLGIYMYIVLPSLMVIGLLLIPIGMLIKIKRKDKTKDLGLKWPVLDLNNQRQRKTLIIVVVSVMVFLLVSAMGSYQAFITTESVQFCGKLCHDVMEPEYVTYQNSPHARVKCVECHVGEGADWYVKSKLSGLYQVYSVTFNKYPRPIPTPIKDLRPARETCEKCHWPQKFYARKIRNQRGYLTDSLNTEWNTTLLMKIGPIHSAYGLKEGIHWHINRDVKIEYIAPDDNRESIPWVKYSNLKTGVVEVFQDSGNVPDQKALDSLPARTMDCMDCHNRPSHSYQSATFYVNNALISGTVPHDLPFIKKIAMEVLKNPFPTTDTAMSSIRDSIVQYYKNNFPQIFSSRKQAIDSAISGIQEEYKKNNFPKMHAYSSNYLNHIGHLESNGCFRCHDNKHKNSSGRVITKDCNLCHVIIAQGTSNNFKAVASNQTMEFEHPIDIDNAWKESLCSECHKTLYP